MSAPIQTKYRNHNYELVSCCAEFVERDEVGDPIRWSICPDCPHRNPWHLNAMDDDFAVELPKIVDAQTFETKCDDSIWIICDEPTDPYPHGNGSPSFEDEADGSFSDESLDDTDVKIVDELDDGFLEKLNLHHDQWSHEINFVESDKIAAQPAPPAEICTLTKNPEASQTMKSVSTDCSSANVLKHKKTIRVCPWCSGTGYLRAGLQCGPCGGKRHVN